MITAARLIIQIQNMKLLAIMVDAVTPFLRVP